MSFKASTMQLQSSGAKVACWNWAWIMGFLEGSSQVLLSDKDFLYKQQKVFLWFMFPAFEISLNSLQLLKENSAFKVLFEKVRLT